MNFIKRGLLILMALMMMVSVVGCAAEKPVVNQPEEVVGNKPVEVVEPPVEEVKQAITVIDHLGREVTLDKPAEKLVSGYYITSSMLVALGLEDNVVGIEAKANSRPIYALSAPELLDLPNVGTAKEFNLEGTIALNPDLVILPVRLKEAIGSLEQMGIKVIGVNPEDVDLLKETMTIIGKLTDTEDRANELIAYYDNAIAEIPQSSTAKPKVYLAGNSDFLSTAGNKMYQNYLIESAGGENVAKEIEDGNWAQISYEQLLAYNPEVIVIVPAAEYTKEDLLNDSKLASIDAVKNKKVYVMPKDFESWDSPVPSAILGTKWLSYVLNEDSLSFDNFKDEVVKFYETFYGFTADKALITK